MVFLRGPCTIVKPSALMAVSTVRTRRAPAASSCPFPDPCWPLPGGMTHRTATARLMAFGEACVTGKRVERRLAAILAADVAGYSRLTGADEEGTVSRLRAAPAGADRPRDRRTFRPHS